MVSFYQMVECGCVNFCNNLARYFFLFQHIISIIEWKKAHGVVYNLSQFRIDIYYTVVYTGNPIYICTWSDQFLSSQEESDFLLYHVGLNLYFFHPDQNIWKNLQWALHQRRITMYSRSNNSREAAVIKIIALDKLGKAESLHFG